MPIPVAPEHVFVAVAAPFVGSFLGVILDRVPDGRAVLWGRSRCERCEATLSPRDLIPLASWLLNGGRCRACKAPLGWYLPGMELAALSVAVWSATVLSGWLFWVTCGLGWALLVLAAIDWRHMILPDSLTLPLIPAGLAVAFGLGADQAPQHVLGAVFGFVTFLVLAQLYKRLRGRDGLGFGDVKLMAGAGAWVAWWGLPSVILIAGTTALAGALAGRLAGRPLTGHTELPFGTFLCLGIWVVWLYGPLAPAG